MNSKTNPWLWIPTLYFAEGIPYFIVNNISVILFTRMGVPNGEMALFTSLIYFPWVIKPLWSPFVDILRTILHPSPLARSDFGHGHAR